MAVLRGGSIPARLLADRLGAGITMLAIGVSSYDGIGCRKPKSSVDVSFQSQSDLHGRNVLVVDDIADSGLTLQVVREHLKERGADGISTATLLWKPGVCDRPDYAGSTARRDEWIVFPWERFEFKRQSSGATPIGKPTGRGASSTTA